MDAVFGGRSQATWRTGLDASPGHTQAMQSGEYQGQYEGLFSVLGNTQPLNYTPPFSF